MLEFTGIGSVLRGIGYLYWAIGIGLLWLALWKGKGWIGKSMWALPVLGVWGYLPVMGYIDYQKRMAFSSEAWAYFKNLCDTKSGEKIHKTFTGVKSVLVIKPLPPAKPEDLYDQFWYGDPYSFELDGSDRSIGAAERLLGSRRENGRGLPDIGFAEIEVPVLKNGETQYQRLTRTSAPTYDRHLDLMGVPQSRFGLSWNDISTPEDRKYWVAASHLKIVDRTDNSVVAERIGYLIEAGFGSIEGQRRPWLNSWAHQEATCPPVNEVSDRWFVLKVLNPVEEKQNGK